MPLRKRIGEHLLELGVLGEGEVRAALDEQHRTGGRLGDILLSLGLVDAPALSLALADQSGLPSFVPEYEAAPVLPRAIAYRERAAVLVGPSGRSGAAGAVLVAVTDLGSVPTLVAELGSSLAPRLTDPQTMDALLADAYAHADGREISRALQRWGTRRVERFGLAALLALATVAGGVVLLGPPALFVAAGAASLYWLAMALAAGRRWRTAAAAGEGSPAEVSALRDPETKSHSLLILLSRETPAALRRLRLELEQLDYPRHRLQGIAVLDPADRATRRSLRSQPLPPWITLLAAPQEAARGRRGLLLYGLRQARGELFTLIRTDAGVTAQTLYAPAGGRGSLARRFLRQADTRSLRRVQGHFRTAELLAAFGWEIDSPSCREAAAA
jgi:hypothetical protein